MTCVYCNKKIEVNFLNLFSINNYCFNCFNNFKIINLTKNYNINIQNYNIIICYNLLFDYNEYAKDYLHFFKRKGDVRICNIFSDFLNYYFKDNFNWGKCSFVYIPSSKKTIKKRNFIPNELLLELVDDIIISNGPIRIDNIKQGKLSIKDRKKQKHKYISKSISPNETLVIFDDVITTGTTISNYLENIDNLDDFEYIYVVGLFSSRYFKNI